MKIILFSEISLDGKLTIGNQSSKKLLSKMSEEESELIQRVRKKHDAILVGGETVRIDNPNLTYRLEEKYSPIRIILSNNLNFSFDENVFTDKYRTVIITASTDKEKFNKIIALNKEIIQMSPDTIVDMREVIFLLEKKLGIDSLIVEGGGQTNWAFVKQNLFDEIHLLQLPIFVGGRDTPSLVGGEGFSEINLCTNYKIETILQYKTSLYLKYIKSERQGN